MMVFGSAAVLIGAAGEGSPVTAGNLEAFKKKSMSAPQPPATCSLLHRLSSNAAETRCPTNVYTSFRLTFVYFDYLVLFVHQ